MYVTGLLSDFMSRMHQGAVDTGSFASYITEGNLYIGSGTGVVSPQMSGQWEREARQRSFLISGTGAFTQLNQQQFRTLLPLPPEIDINAASNATQTSSGQPIVWSWSALPNGGAGVSGIRVYFCQDPPPSRCSKRHANFFQKVGGTLRKSTDGGSVLLRMKLLKISFDCQP
jgi:hypothetical protein